MRGASAPPRPSSSRHLSRSAAVSRLGLAQPTRPPRSAAASWAAGEGWTLYARLGGGVGRGRARLGHAGRRHEGRDAGAASSGRSWRRCSRIGRGCSAEPGGAWRDARHDQHRNDRLGRPGFLVRPQQRGRVQGERRQHHEVGGDGQGHRGRVAAPSRPCHQSSVISKLQRKIVIARRFRGDPIIRGSTRVDPPADVDAKPLPDYVARLFRGRGFFPCPV